MAIYEILEKPSFKIAGKIRLGVTKQNKSGSQYPTNVEHFVLTDCPEVEAIYGKDPKELHIMFPTEDIDMIAPTWLKLYKGGTLRPDGSRKGGELLCKGTGPHADGSPGTAFHRERRDPVTGVIPERPCLGKACPDVARGCKPTMSIVAFLPLVSMSVLYQIDTASITSIRDFHNTFATINAMPKEISGGIARRPFKITRTPTEITFFDKDKKKNITSTHAIMRLAPADDFMAKYGQQLIESFKKLEANPFRLALSEGESIPDVSDDAMEDHFPAALEAPQAKLATAQELVNDEEVRGLFAKVGSEMGQAFSDKAILIWIRKHESAPGDLRDNVIKALQAKLGSLGERVVEQPAVQQQAPTPVMDAEGIM